MSKVCFLIEDVQDIQPLFDTWQGPAEGIDSIAVGDEALAKTAAGVFSCVRWANPAGELAETVADSVAQAVIDGGYNAVLGVAHPGVRTAAAKAAAKTSAAVLSNVRTVTPTGEKTQVTRTVFDDYVETSEVSGPMFALMNPVMAKGSAPAETAAAGTVVALDAAGNGQVKVTGVIPETASPVQTAKLVVAVGFGARKPEAFAAAKELAGAMNATLGASMSIVENTTLMPGERYIGISGVKIAPKLYVAMGISGTAQHLVGIRNAETVVVVNSDPKAKFFDHADYGIVGTIEDVAPAIIRALG